MAIIPKINTNKGKKKRYPESNPQSNKQPPGEVNIIWVENPAKYFFVRCRVVETRMRYTPIGRKFLAPNEKLIGYSVLSRGYDRGNIIQRRIFFIRPDDIKPDCPYIVNDCHPSEGIDPLTVRPGVWGHHKQPLMRGQ